MKPESKQELNAAVGKEEVLKAFDMESLIELIWWHGHNCGCINERNYKESPIKERIQIAMADILSNRDKWIEEAKQICTSTDIKQEQEQGEVVTFEHLGLSWENFCMVIYHQTGLIWDEFRNANIPIIVKRLTDNVLELKYRYDKPLERLREIRTAGIVVVIKDISNDLILRKVSPPLWKFCIDHYDNWLIKVSTPLPTSQTGVLSKEEMVDENFIRTFLRNDERIVRAEMHEECYKLIQRFLKKILNKPKLHEGAIKLKEEILARFSPFLKQGNIDYTENLSAQLDLYASQLKTPIILSTERESSIQFLKYYLRTATLAYGSTGENEGLSHDKIYDKFLIKK